MKKIKIFHENDDLIVMMYLLSKLIPRQFHLGENHRIRRAFCFLVVCAGGQPDGGKRKKKRGKPNDKPFFQHIFLHNASSLTCFYFYYNIMPKKIKGITKFIRLPSAGR